MLRNRRFAPLALAALLFVAIAGLSACEPATPGQAAADAAVSQVGVKYTYGGASPATGFDCSGLTSWAWKQAGKTLPRSSRDQYAGTTRITKAQLQPGDLVFYASSGTTVSHVAMYIGDGKIVQARKTGYPVEVQSVDWWSTNRVGYGRVR